jgi:hypothetical protein
MQSIKRSWLRAESSSEQLQPGPSPTSGRSSRSTRSDSCPPREEFPQLPPLPKDLGRPPLPSPSVSEPHVFHNISNTDLAAAAADRPSGRAVPLTTLDKDRPFRPASFGKGPPGGGPTSGRRLRSGSRPATVNGPQTNGRHTYERGIVYECAFCSTLRG